MKKLLAIVMTGMVALGCVSAGCGLSAAKAEVPAEIAVAEVEKQETEAPATVAASPEANEEEAVEQVTSAPLAIEFTAEPEGDANGDSEKPDAAEQPGAATEPEESPAADASETEVPGTELPPADPTGAPEETVEATPEATIEVLDEHYAVVKDGTAVYADKACTQKLGEFAGTQTAWVDEVATYENGSLYEVRFDTEQSRGEAECEVGYFYAKAVERLTAAEGEQLAAKLSDARIVGGVRIPQVSFRYEAQPEETEQPTAPEGAYIDGDSVNVRAAANADSERVAQLDRYTPVTVLGSEKSIWNEIWYVVRFEGGEGYVHSDYVANAVAAEPEETEEPEQDERTLAEIIEETNPERGITVNAAWDTDELAMGSTVTLTMDVVGYDGLTCTVFWQCDKGDGWETVSEGEMAFSFVADEENVHWQWRAGVNITEVQ